MSGSTLDREDSARFSPLEPSLLICGMIGVSIDSNMQECLFLTLPTIAHDLPKGTPTCTGLLDIDLPVRGGDLVSFAAWQHGG